MGCTEINGLDLLKMLKVGSKTLEANKSGVDALNVFPVPDGDTGTNMYLTLTSAVREAEKNENENIAKVGKAVSMGSLMGARGNSGVILSQIFRGMAKEMEGKTTLDAKGVASALQAGADTAYKAVMKPVEGTILTVVREMAKAAVLKAKNSDDIIAVLEDAYEAGQTTLRRTPNMLPILKEAGVVDAGGQGLLYLLKGMIKALKGEEEEKAYQEETVTTGQDETQEGLTYLYCTEVLIRGQRLDIEEIRDELEPLGDSLLVVGEEDVVKVHIHSNHPGKVLEVCLSRGKLYDIKINNMEEEVEERLNKIKELPLAKIGVVAVSQGDGFSEILTNLGVMAIVNGGQTMNPSTEELVKAVEEVKAEKVILLPNNKNIIMAARQAAEISTKPVAVVPTTSPVQAVTAMVAFNPDMELEEVAQDMSQEIEKVITGEVTQAVRDSQINGLQIKAGDFIGIVGDEIKVKAATAEDAVMLILEQMAEEGELITIFYGKDVADQEAIELKKRVEEGFSRHEVEMHKGGQPHYHYLLSVE